MKDSELKKHVEELLERFYVRRLTRLRKCSLKRILSKNPYLFRAIGLRKGTEVVEGTLRAYLSSSDETLFGNEFFEPLAKAVGRARGYRTSTGGGIDLDREDDKSIVCIAVKSSPNIQNASAQARQDDEFRSIHSRVKKSRKHFDPIVAYCYGRAIGTPRGKIFRRLAGQAFWKELSGDQAFYLRIIAVMGDLPDKHREEYDKTFAAVVNELVTDFGLNFLTETGEINWNKLVEFSSAEQKPQKLQRIVRDIAGRARVVAEAPDTDE